LRTGGAAEPRLWEKIGGGQESPWLRLATHAHRRSPSQSWTHCGRHRFARTDATDALVDRQNCKPPSLIELLPVHYRADIVCFDSVSLK
jgi:hypothetical protein